MKRVEVAVRGTEDPLHPLVPFLTGDAVDRAAMVDWNGVTRSGDADESTVVLRIHADPGVVRDAFADEPVIDDFALSVVDDCCFVQAYSETARLEGATARALTPPGVVAVPPVRYETGGWVAVTLVGTDDAVQTAVDRVPDEVDVDVRSVSSKGYGETTDPLDALTDRQRDAVLAAVDAGYYDTPRSGDVAAVADALDCAPSTAAEHLRKAEARLVSELADRHRE
ncbi:MAG: helix-turn-helix domain-containing protein [Halobacterium sp.]